MENCTDINPTCEQRFDLLDIMLQKTADGVEQMLSRDKENTSSLKDMNKRLFIDNGEESFQTFRRKTETFMRVLVWTAGIFFATVITTTVGIMITNAIKQ